MSNIDYLEDALQAINTGANNLNSKTLAQINAMNIELKNADGTLAGKYKLSEFLENVIYSYLTTTKASSLASVLGEIFFGPKAKNLSPNTSIDNLSTTGVYRCPSQSAAQSIVNSPFNTGYLLFLMSPYMLKEGVIDFGVQIAVSHGGIKGRRKIGFDTAWSDWVNVVGF